MNNWYTAMHLAGLPGMPSSSRRVRARAMKEGWRRRAIATAGGDRHEFHIESLPAETRAALSSSDSDAAHAGREAAAKLTVKKDLEDAASRNRRVESLKQSTSLSDEAQRRLDAKLEILRAVETYRGAHALAYTVAELRFADQYPNGFDEISAETRALLPRVSVSSLARWRKNLRREGIARLAGGYGNRRGSGTIDTQAPVHDLVVGMLVRTPHARATHVMKALRARLSESPDMVLPSLRTLERWIAKWKRDNAQTFLAIANPDGWKSRYMVSHGSASADVVRLNQRWELDSTPADVLLADGRYSLIGVLEVYARRGKLLLAKTSKAVSIAALTRRALIQWGVPEEAVTDNGADYVSHHVSRVWASLDVRHATCQPFAPWGKPHIERFFRTFAHDLVELLDNFIGHNVAQRQAIRDRQSFADRLMKRGEAVEISMTAQEFQAFCDRWCEDLYAHQPHEGLDRRTPFEVAASWVDPIRHVDDERALDVLLAAAPGGDGMRTVQKKGIKLDDGWYIAPELEAYVGQPVQVRYDEIEHDLGHVYVFSGADMQFICIAEDPERAGVDRREVAIRARQVQKQRVQEERRALKAVSRRVKADEIVADILRERARASGKLALFPRPATAHESAGLVAASEAAALTRPARSTADLMSSEEYCRERARIEATQSKPVQPVFNTPFDRAYWIATQALERALTGEESEYLERFRRAQPRSAVGLDELLAARRGGANAAASD